MESIDSDVELTPESARMWRENELLMEKLLADQNELQSLVKAVSVQVCQSTPSPRNNNIIIIKSFTLLPSIDDIVIQVVLPVRTSIVPLSEKDLF